MILSAVQPVAEKTGEGIIGFFSLSNPIILIIIILILGIILLVAVYRIIRTGDLLSVIIASGFSVLSKRNTNFPKQLKCYWNKDKQSVYLGNVVMAGLITVSNKVSKDKNKTKKIRTKNDEDEKENENEIEKDVVTYQQDLMLCEVDNFFSMILKMTVEFLLQVKQHRTIVLFEHNRDNYEQDNRGLGTIYLKPYIYIGDNTLFTFIYFNEAHLQLYIRELYKLYSKGLEVELARELGKMNVEGNKNFDNIEIIKRETITNR